LPLRLRDPGDDADALIVEVRADAFLRGMMRAIAGALVRVGQGRADQRWIEQLLHQSSRHPSLTVAPAHGLHQWRVTYGAAA
jgi:tRNA pseudouridine38-40 synthase